MGSRGSGVERRARMASGISQRLWRHAGWSLAKSCSKWTPLGGASARRRSGWFSTTSEEASGTARSVDAKEVAKFAAMADEWWDTAGPYGALHRLNYARSPFIRMAVCDHYGKASTGRRPLEGLSLVEVGCGGGILSESLAVMGSDVKAIDAAEESVQVAKKHLKRNALLRSRTNLTYEATTAESLVEKGEAYDVVVSSEVVEHVLDPPGFCKTLSNLCKPGGLVVMSTLNRTLWSYSLAIVAAERILGMAPRGAHDWDQFVTPEELCIMCEDAGLELGSISGMRWSVPKGQFELTKDLSVNYIAAFRKEPPRQDET